MRIADLLVAAGIASAEDVTRAVDMQADNGDRLADNLIALGAASPSTLETFFDGLPREPTMVETTGISRTELLGLLLKLIYSIRLETLREFVDAIKLSPSVVEDIVRMAQERGLLQVLGAQGVSSSISDMRYSLTELGRRWAQDAQEQSQYCGPAPVTLQQFVGRVHAQKITGEVVTMARLRAALAGLTIGETFLERIGPALGSGRPILLYGPPGNGKTSVALRLAHIFNAVVYIPYAVLVEGQIMRVYDPSFHHAVGNGDAGPVSVTAGIVRRDEFDARWVACRRPFVVAGGELTLAMLDLGYDPVAKYYEAPLHVKALGGCFVIDDFGRQLVEPTTLLNRWIVPLENQIDYLKLHTGKSFSIPFEELVIFSTNLAPEDLMDQAFLRRLPYKLEVGTPSREEYKRIFAGVCAAANIAISDQIFDAIVHKICHEKGLTLANYQPKFIVDQIVAAAKFLNVPPDFRLKFVDAALDNLKVKT